MTTLSDLNSSSDIGFVDLLHGIYEHSPWIAQRAAAARPFESITALKRALQHVLAQASPAEQLGLIRAHPELAGKAAIAGQLTAESTREQAKSGLNLCNPEEFSTLQRLNQDYNAKFGFPFIVCVRRHTRDSILRQFERRLRHDASAEFATALQEIFYITRLRVAAKVTGEGMPKVNGRLSTHVLDTHAGRPAAGVAVELFEYAGEQAHRIVRTVTNADGRTDQPLIGDRPLPIGRYELRFAMGDHFRRRDIEAGDPPFLDIVPLRFSIAEPEGHYHVPLLCSPWSYSTYRGS